MLQAARWIGCGTNAVTPYIHRTFTLCRPQSGIIEVTGLGFFKLWINGHLVSEELHNPAPSQYERRDLTRFGYPIFDELTLRIYYRRYDISEFLKDGENKLTLLLGNGWYRQKERIAEGNVWYGEALKAIFAISVQTADGAQSIVSDGSEVYTDSYITYSNLFVGEVQNAELLNADLPSFPVEILPDSEAELTLQDCPSDRVIRTITPTMILQDGNRTVYDAGENITGRVSLMINAPKGERVSLRFAEEIEPDGTLNFVSTGSLHICASGVPQIQQDVFIGDGEAHRMVPEFIWHCFRYFEIVGAGAEPVVEVIHTDLPVTSSFDSDSEVLNWLYDAYIRTQLNNIHGCVPSDCPQRERLGYLGDAQVTCEASMLLLDSVNSYRKWMQDILDCQDKESGHVQHTAPFMGGGGGPGGWGGAVVFVPYQYYRKTGDWDWVRHCYPAMAKWVSYMISRSEDGLIVREEKDGWCLGDWASVGTLHLPEPFANTCYFADALQKLAFLAKQLGKEQDAAYFIEQADLCKAAVKQHYYDPATGSYCHGIQGADAHALYIGMDEDARTLENLDARYRSLGYFDTGYFGTDELVDVLFRNGKGDTAYKLLTTETEGGYLWMKRAGATTVWEFLGRQFGENNSHCHPMFCGPVRQLFSSILGIRQPELYVGYKEVEIAPVFVDGLSRAAGSITLDSGVLSVKWQRNGEGIELTVCIPAGVHAVFVHDGAKRELVCGENRFTV